MTLPRRWNSITLLLLVGATLSACNTVEIPTEKYYQFSTNASVWYENDTLHFYLNNPVACPLRYYLSSSDSSFDKILASFKPIILQHRQDTVLSFATDSATLTTLSYPNMLGDFREAVKVTKMSLPFPKNRHYKIIQGYNGSHSHSDDDYSRYAIDISLSEGDTVCAADDGVVVGVIKDYRLGGDDRRFMEHVNLVTIFHYNSRLFTQYLHLRYNGSLVSIGDTVMKGQPIALSGRTGFTDVDHLHFSALKPVNTTLGLNAVKVSFMEGYNGEDLKRNDRVKK